MLRDQRSLWRWLMALGVISVFLQAPGLRAQDEPAGEEEEEEAPDIRLRGWTGLKVPEGSEDEDARGWSVVYQRGSRQALHVYVRGLEPGASYSVSASQGDESESIGSITTRDAEVSAPRCFRTGLRVPAGGDEGGGDEGGGDEGGGGAHWSRDRDRGPRGGASVFVNEDGTAARYGVWVRGLDGDVAGARIVLGDGAALELDAAELSGSVELGEGQRDQLASAIVEILTAAEGEEPAVALAGDLEQCASDSTRIAAMRCLSAWSRSQLSKERSSRSRTATATSSLLATTTRSSSSLRRVGGEGTIPMTTMTMTTMTKVAGELPWMISTRTSILPRSQFPRLTTRASSVEMLPTMVAST